MKTAIYIEMGVAQVVLTPETEAERSALGLIREGDEITVKKGGFYWCQGGWHRQSGEDDSTMLLVREPGGVK